ncbi:uncharacterized protein [Argopecten irradians]|uniref:uncharacterized protein n=1 Tax=Argopecten irradians TaxID=31199 RepID=UPI00371EB605
MENECGYCGKKPLSLRRCSACKEVYYCSPVCQRLDWKGQHKVKCEEIQYRRKLEYVNVSDDTPFVPKRENKGGTVLYPTKSIGGNAQEVYIEQERQAGRHNLYALSDMVSGHLNFFADMEGGKNKTQHKTCTVCGKLGAEVKTCARCKMVDYCSKNCQKKDRKKHKLECKEAKEEDVKTKPKGGFGQETNASAKSTNANRDTSSRIHSKPTVRDLSVRLYAKPVAMDKAKSLAWKAFPGCNILDFIREIPPELFGMRPRSTSNGVVGFISRFHEYIFRHCIFLQDKDGDEVYVAFYFERDDPSPYFQWEDVVPGRYICIEDPYIHPFRDESVGIPVDSPSSVRVFSI